MSVVLAQINLKTLKNETKKILTIPSMNIVHMFYGGIGRLLLRTPESVVLYDIQTPKVIKELPTPGRFPIKYTVWSGDHKHLALFSKQNIYVTNANLEELCTVTETTRIKSGAWDPAGVFIYTTATHIKYLLTNGDSGVIRTLETPIYITAVSSSAICYLGRHAR